MWMGMNIGNYIACAAGGALLGSYWGVEGAMLGAVFGVVFIMFGRWVDKNFGGHEL